MVGLDGFYWLDVATFQCNHPVTVTSSSGKLRNTKREVSPSSTPDGSCSPQDSPDPRNLRTAKGRENTIVDVDWTEVKRITSKGNKGNLPIEIFRYAVNTILKQGYISRDTINQNYTGRGSSGIVMILSQVPIFELVDQPKIGLRLR